MIRFEDVSVGPIKELSVELEEGRLYALLGPSGSGKTAFLCCLAGIAEPAKGKVYVSERALYHGRRASDLHHRERVGMVFSHQAVLPDRSTLENVRLPLDLRGVPVSEGDERALALLKQVDLNDAAHRLPNELSGGMRTRLQVARALAAEPNLLLFDGPTAGLDPVTAARLLKMIRAAVSDRRSTGFVSTQDIGAVLPSCDGVLLLSGGTLRGPLPPVLAGDVAHFAEGVSPW